MKLYLCGGGSSKQIEITYKDYSKSIDKSKKVLYIPLATEEEKFDSCKEWFANEIKNLKKNKKQYNIFKRRINNSC